MIESNCLDLKKNVTRSVMVAERLRLTATYDCKIIFFFFKPIKNFLPLTQLIFIAIISLESCKTTQ